MFKKITKKADHILIQEHKLSFLRVVFRRSYHLYKQITALLWLFYIKFYKKKKRIKLQSRVDVSKLLIFGFNKTALYENNYLPNKKKVFYCLHNSLPFNSGGYATRTHGILSAVKCQGWDINGVNRLGYPFDAPAARISCDYADVDSCNQVDDVSYYNLGFDVAYLDDRNRAYYQQLPLNQYLNLYCDKLLELCKQEKPLLIHAASNYLNGIAANYVANSLRIPSVYEVRGLFEMTQACRVDSYHRTIKYHSSASMEARAAKNATHVFALTNALKRILISRGVEPSKITILPNAVDTSRFTPLERDEELAKQLGIGDVPVIGYIGSIVDYEGLDLLLKSLSIVKDNAHTKFKALIVGDGSALNYLKELSDELSLGDSVIFTGRVPHSQVEQYYSLIDICPLPRVSMQVCEAVSPLKPFEAMAMEKALIVSSVDALDEIVENEKNGFVFEKGNIVELANLLELLIKSDGLRYDIGKSARKWVVKERDWSSVAKIVSNVYEDILSK